MTRDIAGPADMGFAARNGDDGHRRFRRNARDFAVNEFVEHEIADAQHRLAGDRL